MNCRHCGRAIELVAGVWVDPEATGDDSVWRETCDEHDTFTAEHEPGRRLRFDINVHTGGLDVEFDWDGYTIIGDLDDLEQFANAILAECEIARRTEQGEFK